MLKYIAVLTLIVAMLVAGCAAPAASSSPGTCSRAASCGSSCSSLPPLRPQPSAEKATLTIESWRNDDLSIWQDVIIPAFNKQYPNIEVIFAPAAPAEYNGVLNTKLEGGTAGDLITCRPFDASLALYDKGYLASLNDLPGMENFSDVAKSAWITDDGSNVFCVPMASVIHGFIYNKEIFDKLGLSEPTTVEEFHAVLDAIKADGTVTALAMGTVDLWESATMGFQNIGPNYWKGEEGRQGLIAGTEKYTDPQYVAVWEELAKLEGLPVRWLPGANLSRLAKPVHAGQAAIYPAGSWEIGVFEPRPTSPWARSSRRCRPALTNATSATTPTSPWA